MKLYAPDGATHVYVAAGCGDGHEPAKDGEIACAKCRAAAEAFTEDDFRGSGLVLREEEKKTRRSSKDGKDDESGDDE